jgi:hypothetical protein
MQPSKILKPLGVFALVIVVIVGASFAVPLALGGGGGSQTDGSAYGSAVPNHFQPSNVNAPSADESGEIQLDAEDKRILVDMRHSNSVERDELDPLVNALARNGHTVDFGAQAGSSGGGGFSSGGYNATLQKYDAVLVIHPTQPFTDQEVAGLKAYANGGGRLAVFGEPTQLVTQGSGLFAQTQRLRSPVNDLTHEFGIHVATQQLYNLGDDATDNYYKSIYASASGNGGLVDGVSQVDFDTSTYVVSLNNQANTMLSAADGTKTYSTRKNGDYSIAARNDNVAVVGDSSFLTTSEVYDTDNEVLASNLLEFLVTGDKPDDVPSTPSGEGASEGGF